MVITNAHTCSLLVVENREDWNMCMTKEEGISSGQLLPQYPYLLIFYTTAETNTDVSQFNQGYDPTNLFKINSIMSKR